MSARFVLVTSVLFLALGSSLALAAKLNSETNPRLSSRASAGEFLGYPSPTYQWHGCKLTAVARVRGVAYEAGEPKLGRGNRSSAVTFTYSSTAPFIKWKTKAGYRVCGAQVTSELDNTNVSALLLGSAGYTSFVRSGSLSTAKNGVESIKVPIKKGDINASGYEQYEGKTFALSRIHAVIVFVKKG